MDIISSSPHWHLSGAYVDTMSVFNDSSLDVAEIRILKVLQMRRP